MEIAIILDTTKSPVQIIYCGHRPGEIRIVDRPSNCFATMDIDDQANDVVLNVQLPKADQLIPLAGDSKGYLHYDVDVIIQILSAQGTNVSLLENYKSSNDLSGYANPKRGYLIYELKAIKPVLQAQGIDITKIEEFEKENPEEN